MVGERWDGEVICFTLDRVRGFLHMKADGFLKRAGESEERRARVGWIREELEKVWREGEEKL